MKVVSCQKCSYSRREKTSNNTKKENELVPPVENHDEYFDGIDILNKLDEQNENS